jgi:hypothetical protein
MVSDEVPPWMDEIVQTAELYQPAARYAKEIQASVAPTLPQAEQYAAQMRDLQTATMPAMEVLSWMNDWLTSTISETDEAMRLTESLAKQLTPIFDAAKQLARDIVPAASLPSFSQAIVAAINSGTASHEAQNAESMTITSTGSVILAVPGITGELGHREQGAILAAFARLSQAEMTFVVLVWVVATLLIAREPTVNPLDAIGYYGAAYGIATMILRSQGH